MICESWREKLDAYLDGQLPVAEARALSEHMRGCAGCAAESLSKVQQKRATQIAAQRFIPDPAFRAKIQTNIAGRRAKRWRLGWLPVLAGAMVLLIAVALFFSLNENRRAEQQLVSELADLHVATLASPNPVDVVSSDRHTVKPWFTGKIPFTFNLPELQGSPFVLMGGRVSYLNQSPGAELIFRVRQHQISVFIFQERAVEGMSAKETASTELSFGVRSWSRNGLRYFVIGDANAEDLDKLSNLLKGSS